MEAVGGDVKPMRERCEGRTGVPRPTTWIGSFVGAPLVWAAVDAAVLVPVKDFRQAKARLAGVLSADERIRLARWTAELVVAAAAPLPVFVACDDSTVAEWAESLGATVLWRPSVGLNAAVLDGINALGAAGIEHAIVAHSDLPLAAALPTLVMTGGIVLVPDGRSDGTNVLAVPTRAGFEPAYGSQSFERHLAHAMGLGVPVRVQRDPQLALDIDTPADLVHPLIAKALPAWLRTNRANHP